jgi:hypothetical protein
MLDECKGDKFYEILALFSAVVLKKVLASKPTEKKKTAVARKLATADALSNKEQESLLPLALAHKAALVNLLKSKEEKRKRFIDFQGLLNAKADGINQRIRKCKETPRAQKLAVPHKESDAIKKQLKDNWIGNHRWLDVMLHGDDVKAEDAFLNGSFEDVWPTVEQGRKLEDAVPDIGLMENLQLRVQEQEARLEKWKSFHASLREDKSVSSTRSEKVSSAKKELKFDHHLQLQLRGTVPNDEPIQRTSIRPDYQAILSEMDEELSRVAETKYSHPSTTQTTRVLSFGAPRSPAQHKKSRSEPAPKVPQPRHANPPTHLRKQSKETIPPRQTQPQVQSVTPMESDATLIGHPSTTNTTGPISRSIESSPQRRYSPEADKETPTPLPTISLPLRRHNIESPSPSPSPSPLQSPPISSFPSKPPIFNPPTLTTEDDLAAQIISTIDTATPSPVKKLQPRLSLAERTRMSMAHTLIFSPIAESPSLPSPSPEKSPPTLSLDLSAQDHPTQSLAERTRISMATMSQSSKPRASLAPREKRPSRSSTFPVNQFDTPRTRKSFHAIEEAKSAEKTPKEELFSDEIDYDRVFKSRPRIATSPIFGTPGGDGDDGGEEYDEYDEGVTGVDLADVDCEEDGDSPLKGAGKGRVMY